MRGPIQSVEVSYIIHATEDQGKVDGAVGGLFSARGEVERETLEGHFGNPIVRVRQRFTGADAESAFGEVAARLPEKAREEIKDRMGVMMDEHSSLFLRLDKQALVSGRLATSEADAVHVRVKPRLYGLKESPAEFFLRALSAEG